ncbi:MAG: hypothetical protein QOJ99_1012 [Bryobacterales bacterium]|nr:hypothetical protein [Bryobacterales bacterium]
MASADRSGDHADIALLIRPDGGMHVIMDTPFALDSAAASNGAMLAYRVTRTEAGVRVVGKKGGRTCVLQGSSAVSFQKAALRDQPLYSITSPLLTSAGPVADEMFRANRGEAASMMPQSM